MVPSAASLLADIPLDIGRDQAQELARRELSQQVYRDAEPSWWERASTWVWQHFADLLAQAGSALGGAGWVFVLLVLLVLVVVLIAWRAGRLERRHRTSRAPVFGDSVRSAAEHRTRADLAASRGDWSNAVVEEFRALVRSLEERGWLDERPGRTADEASRDAAMHFPTEEADLLASAQVFDEVAYGEREGTAAGFEMVRGVGQRLSAGVPTAGR